MKPMEWTTYRTRFLVKARQLSSALSFTDPLGRQHCGRRGDYLVESSDGVLSIAPRQIFQDIYVPVSSDSLTDGIAIPKTFDRRGFHPPDIEKGPAPAFPQRRRTDPHEPSRHRRKSPEPVRTNRPPSHLGLM